ncbi:MAG: cupin domain-containing protein [Candidatus Sulfotelmatobacter sp.]
MKSCILFLFLTGFLTAQTTQEVEITAEPHHQLVLANDQVRVFDVDVPPHSETLMHWHRHDYIYVVLGDAEIVNAVQGKDPVSLRLSDGEVRFVPAAFAHVFRNLSGQAFRNVTIELLQDHKLRHSPTHWDPAHPEEDRGLDILNGGTREILFVKDGVRVSEFELQPGALTPLHQHGGPHLVVALSDYELRSDVAGKGSETITMKRGESR